MAVVKYAFYYAKHFSLDGIANITVNDVATATVVDCALSIPEHATELHVLVPEDQKL